jgi:MFS superfamily sulfate permease-like transporter
MLILAAVRLDVVASCTSEPVLRGFKAGIGLLVILHQVPRLFASISARAVFFQNPQALFHHLHETSPPTLVVAVAEDL